jgi:hypothetical protein
VTLVRPTERDFVLLIEAQAFAVQSPVVLKPESSGTVAITSSSIYDKPIIDPK